MEVFLQNDKINLDGREEEWIDEHKHTEHITNLDFTA